MRAPLLACPLLLLCQTAAAAPAPAAARAVLIGSAGIGAGGTVEATVVSRDGLIWSHRGVLPACNMGGIDIEEGGFLARSQEEERRCPGLLAQLGQDPGAQQLDDVRLVFAPERAVADFGGPDASTRWPRLSLDVVLLRVYRADKPAAPAAWAPISVGGPRDGAAVSAMGGDGKPRSGTVRGSALSGRHVHWAARVGDLFVASKRAHNQPPQQLPRRFNDAMQRLDFSVPLDVAVSIDTLPRGTALWGEDGRMVGAALSDAPVGGERRCVALSSNGLLHALDGVYGAKHLVDELLASAQADVAGAP